MMLPLILLTIRTRPARSLQTRDCAAEGANAPGSRSDLLFSRVFIVATTSGALFAIGMGSIYYHVVSVLIKAGCPTHSAGLEFGASWVLSAFGSPVLGVIAERLGARTILAVALLSAAFGTLFLLGASEARISVACVIAFVFLWGTSANSVFQFTPVIFVERFGPQNLGTLIGVQSSIMGIAGAAAPVVTGLLYDRFSDYRLAIYLSASATFLAFVMVLLINAPKRADRTQRVY